MSRRPCWRFLFTHRGWLTGLYGIMLILGLLILNACSINPYGVPYSAPITPFEKGAMRDLVLRVAGSASAAIR